MENKLDWVDRPLWVRVSLFGMSTRVAALVWVWISIALGVAITAAGLFLFTVYMTAASIGLGGYSFFAALWYWLAIQWTDEHDAWARMRRTASPA